jgi:drug/metabolite transporter (DMT)-like permease
MKPERASLSADLALLAVTAIWGLTFPAIQRALAAVTPLSFITARFGLAALALLIVFPRRALRISRRGLAVAALLGLWLAAGTALQTTGLLYTTASKSAFITGLYVVLVPVFGILVSRIIPRWTSAVAVLLAASGLYLLTSPGVTAFNRGDLLTLGCAVAFALHIVTAARAAPRHDPVPLAFWQIVATAILCAALMGAVERPRFPITPWTVFALLLTGVFATALAFAVQMWAQRRTSATHVAVIFTAEPVFAALFARLLQHDVLGAGGLLGAALILAGILLAQLPSRPRPPQTPS